MIKLALTLMSFSFFLVLNFISPQSSKDSSSDAYTSSKPYDLELLSEQLRKDAQANTLYYGIPEYVYHCYFILEESYIHQVQNVPLATFSDALLLAIRDQPHEPETMRDWAILVSSHINDLVPPEEILNLMLQLESNKS